MRTFTQRLALRFAALVTVTTAVVLTVGGWLLERQMVRSIQVLHAAEFRELRTLMGNSPEITAEEVSRRIRYDADNDTALYLIQVHSAPGAILFRSPNLGANVLPDFTGHDLHGTVTLPGIGPVHVSEFNDGPWHVQIASPLAPLRRLLNDYVKVAALLVLAVAGAGLGLGFAFSRLTLQPVRAIEQTARRIGGDTLGERIPVPAGRDELASLAVLLNQMFDRLEASFDQVRRFTADASHELKTPLALVRLNAEKLRPRLQSDPEALSTLEDLLEEIARLHRIIDSLLFLSRADSGVLALKAKAIDVPDFVRDFAEDAAALAQDQRAHFVLGTVAPGRLRGEPTLLRQLLLNLATNALSFTPEGGVVELSATRQEAGWVLTVTDEGPGLPPEQLERVFERFVRLETAENRSRARGHGLGLAICRTIARMHGGSIRCENRPDRPGLRVVVLIPDSKASDA